MIILFQVRHYSEDLLLKFKFAAGDTDETAEDHASEQAAQCNKYEEKPRWRRIRHTAEGQRVLNKKWTHATLEYFLQSFNKYNYDMYLIIFCKRTLQTHKWFCPVMPLRNISESFESRLNFNQHKKTVDSKKNYKPNLLECNSKHCCRQNVWLSCQEKTGK